MGKDEVDGGGDEEEGQLCTYLVVHSLDQLNINLTPPAIDVLTEIMDVSRMLKMHRIWQNDLTNFPTVFSGCVGYNTI